MDYKIVDSFNGHEDDRRFATEAAAEDQLKKDRAAFFARPENRNASCRLAVVPEGHTWRHSPRFGWIWG